MSLIKSPMGRRQFLVAATAASTSAFAYKAEQQSTTVAKPPLSEEERRLTYSKYYDLALDPINPMAAQIMRNGPMNPKDALLPENLADMFRPGYQDAVLGYCILDNGAGYTSIYAQLPSVTIEMIDWWFVWHFMPPRSVPREYGNLRYKIWCPLDHWDTYTADEYSTKRFSDESIPISLRRQGTSSVIVESLDLGQGATKKSSTVFCRRHDELDLPKEAWDYIHATGTLTIATGGDSPDNSSGLTVQFFRRTAYGCEAIHHTWSGYGLGKDGKVVQNPKRKQTTLEALRQSMFHNLTEVPHFAKFLPQLYAEEGQKPVTAY